MSSPKTIRVFSDIHIGHRASLLRDPEQMAPLLRDVESIVFNGDTFEMRTRKATLEAQPLVETMSALIHSQRGVSALYINGNHDPHFSANNAIDLRENRIFVTHGDILFDDVAPWSRSAGALRKFTKMLRAAVRPEDLNDINTLMRLHKQASSDEAEAAGESNPDAVRGPLHTAISIGWPPHRPFRMLHAWAVLPGRARSFTRRHRRRAQVVLLGHTHRPGVWTRDGITIINTGSFLPYLGRLAVDIEGDRVIVRKLVFANGRFDLGRTVCRVRLDA